MNGPATPAFVKDNAFTRLINRVSELNASQGFQAGNAVEQSENFRAVIPAHQLRHLTPEQAARLDHIPSPVSPEEIMRANAAAAVMGVREADDLLPPGMVPGGNTDVSDGPTEAEIEEMIPPKFRTRTNRPANSGLDLPVDNVGALDQAVAMIQQRPGRNTFRVMPNFAAIEAFDLVRKVAVIDGTDFPLADIHIRDLKRFALDIVLDNVVAQVANALAALGIPPEMAQAAADKVRETAATAAVGSVNAGDQAVQSVQGSKTDNGVLPGSQMVSSNMQDVQEDSESGEDGDWLLADRD